MAGGHRDSVTPRQLLQLFEEGTDYSRPLLTKNPNEVLPPPSLLPGETLMLQQSNVSCIGTLNTVANGVLHLTNYRIIFMGSSIQDKTMSSPTELNAEDLARQGYRYQRRKYQFPMNRMNPQLKKFQSYIGRSVKISRRSLGNSLKKSKKIILSRKYSLDEELSDASRSADDSTCMITQVRPLTDEPLQESNGRIPQVSDQVCISIPNLSVWSIQKFPKQYLEKEKLMMLQDGILITCTNLQSFKFGLGGTDTFDADELIARLVRHVFVKSISSAFVMTYSRSLSIPLSCNLLEDRTAPNFYQREDEYRRFGVIQGNDFKLKRQKVCETYPTCVFVPSESEASLNLKKIAAFHTNGCFPSIVWRHSTGNLLLRSSLPLSQRGNAETRCKEDEYFLAGVCKTGSSTSELRLKIFTQWTKQPNTPTSPAMSGNLPVEEGQRYYYPHCQHVLFDDMPDCQAVNDSGVKLMNALMQRSDNSRFLTSIEETGWLQQIQTLLKAASSVALTLEADKVNAVIAFSNGTDQTAQVSCLTQLMLDPLYRTLDGFQILLQKEWISYRHQFVERNCSSLSKDEDISPVFLQFLDCVWQLTRQFPTYFQFNEDFLESLAKHSYSGRFGTFLDLKTPNDKGNVSFWTWVNVITMSQDSFTNPIYDEEEANRPIFPETGIEWIQIWSWHTRFLREENLFQASEIEMMQTEKLQREYKELVDKYLKLMQQLSDRDEGYMVTFHSRSVGELSSGSLSHLTLSSASDSDSSPVPTLDRRTGHGRAKGMSTIFYKKSKSFDDFLAFTKVEQDGLRHGHSTFYDVTDGGKAGSMERKGKVATLPSSIEISDKFTGLKDYLERNGIKTEGVTDVQISAKSCCGYLVKQGKLHKNWKKRWFVLDLQKLCIAYFDHPTKEPKRVFSYHSIRDVRPHPDQHKNPNLFSLHTFERTFHIQAPDHRAMDIWIACLSVPLTALLPG